MWRFWIDSGGTFTDCLARAPEGEELRIKVLSSGAVRGRIVALPEPRVARVDLSVETVDDFFAGYELRVHGVAISDPIHVVGWDSKTGELKLGAALPEEALGALCSIQSPEEAPLLGARLLTGSLLDQALPPMEMRLATTRGTNALLEGKGVKIAFFVTKGFGDLLRIGTQQRPDLFELGIQKRAPLHAKVLEVDERLDASGKTLVPLDEAEVAGFARECLEEGIEAVAVALLHSDLNPDHENAIERVLKREGLRRVSMSSALSPSIKLLLRAETAVVDAYLAPVMEAYLDAVQSKLPEISLKVMTSAGGLVSRESYRPKDSLLSGPAGGVVGAACSGRQAGFERSIAFDMGGTSTDVSRFEGRLEYQFEQEIGGAKVFAPSLRIETVAAGGGSICWYDGSALRVGPQSAGAFPGPACYGAGGPLTITDVNLLLGRMDPDRFGIPVVREAAEARLRELLSEVESGVGVEVAAEAVLAGLLDIANERMAEAIRGISLREGYSPSDYALVAFGGAGGMHACAVSENLEIDTVLFPSDAGLLSAYGLQQARLERFRERQILQPLTDCLERLDAWREQLVEEAREALLQDGAAADQICVHSVQLEMRFAGQEASLLIDYVATASIEAAFLEQFERQYGFIPKQQIEAVSMKVSLVAGEGEIVLERFAETTEARGAPGDHLARESLPFGWGGEGPLVIQDAFSTVFVDAGWRVSVGDRGTLRLTRSGEAASAKRTTLEAVELELNTNRFLALVEEMGSLLERSAFSTNIKERKDFSCALLDGEGYLVANAPHVPVHLGALGVCVRTLVRKLDLGPGDVAITNHPGFGGSHLPDVTLVAAVYSDDGERIGYVANRAHHAELGGIAPGSMPPQARSLAEEGVVIAPTFLVRAGTVDWEGVKQLLTQGPYPTRRLSENLSDLAAQLASIRFGERELQSLANREGVSTITRFMRALRQRAADALRTSLARLPFEDRQAVEKLDNGAAIAVRVRRQGEKWEIDFAGSAPVQSSNYNATPAIVTSAAIYALRLLAKESIPLNEGFLDVVDIRIPEGMLSPRFGEDPASCPPVVAGNVEVSQRIVDVLIKALGIAACSQGTMNNLIFGNDRVSYYETIAGGEGATAERPGASGVHTHMTNTAITDPEIIERRFPVRLERFALRSNSGGAGIHRGGDGVCRRIRFLEPMEVSLLMQHRSQAPFGANGGENGQIGEQRKLDTRGNRTPLSGNASCRFAAGEAIEILTPGGGGWGSPES